MKEFGVKDVFELICRSGGKASYREMAAVFNVDSSSMKLRNCLVKLRKRGDILYIASESAWMLTDAGRRKAGL